MKSFNNFEASIDKTIASIEAHSLGIPRAKMPQLDAEFFNEFFDFLKKRGIEVKSIKVDIDKLKATQKEFSPVGVRELLSKTPEKLSKVVFVSKDNHLIDGHHRWTALRILSPGKMIPAYKIDLPIREALKVMAEFPKTRYSTRKVDK